MKTIIITGPSGSGKTILSNKLAQIYKNSIVIETDSYYRDNLIIKLFAIFKYEIYDRLISINYTEILKTIDSIYNKERSIIFYNYDFRRKISRKKLTQLNKPNDISFLIIEGIFSHRLNINYAETINILCTEKKEICYLRRLKRDQLERGRNTNEVNKKFNKSWELYFNNLMEFINKNQVIQMNPMDRKSYKKLTNRLNHLLIEKKNK
tara:strand:+ start:181 stop:804 length:624 start_codon:yes stop_codon:yes gene_type:complete